MRSPASSAIIDLLFPPRCAGCGAECLARDGEPLFCEACLTELSPTPRPACPRCAMPCTPADREAGDCFACRGHRLLYEQARVLGVYQGPLRGAVLRIKHYQHEPLAAALGQRLAEEIRQAPFDPPPQLVAPVPMHWLKRVWRGTNAPDTLAQSVARALGVRVARNLLVCRRILRRQSSLLPDQRRQNVRGAYRTSIAHKVKGASVLVVDDVITTGATAQDAARALRQAGAAAVYVAAVARGTGDF